MSTQITLDLPDHLYERAQALAAEQQQEVVDVITFLLRDALAAKSSSSQRMDASHNIEKIEQEVDAFVALHDELQKLYFGEYVALLHGKVVDRDSEFGAIMQRINAAYPNDAVLVRKVDKTPTRTIHLRSPRHLPRE
jgi:hypothetical protein